MLGNVSIATVNLLSGEGVSMLLETVERTHERIQQASFRVLYKDPTAIPFVGIRHSENSIDEILYLRT